MARTLTCGLLALVFVAAGSGSARADWWRYSAYTPSYYYPVYYYAMATPVYYYVQPPLPACLPSVVRPALGSTGLAQPSPAPASQYREPPLDKKKPGPPTVMEQKSFSSDPGKEDCRVGFWNISGRDVKLSINGKTHSVPKDRNLTLMLGRAFTWQLDGREPRTESVADDQVSHEIVIR